MSESVYRVVRRVIRRRFEAGEDLETILAHYSKLSPEQCNEIRAELIPPEPDPEETEAE